ncbi:hypothetical protein J4482_04230 [Candidatus Woesearchaeota archaeon]|nr:hypothetical protein [Candidatus Woesearchaeota archaeon]
MYSIKSSKGTYKGNIGEFMFAQACKYVFITKFHGRHKYFPVIQKYLTEQQKEFLFTNWYSIDAIEVKFNEGVFLYEIKTQSHLNYRLPNWKPKATERSIKIYKEAKKLGFSVKLAIVELYNNWEYDIVIDDFSENLVCIDKAKKYDSAYSF